MTRFRSPLKSSSLRSRSFRSLKHLIYRLQTRCRYLINECHESLLVHLISSILLPILRLTTSQDETEVTHQEQRAEDHSIFPPVIHGFHRIMAVALLRPPESMQVDPRMRRSVGRIRVKGSSAASAQNIVRGTDGVKSRL
jgi:hypothetical protein